MHPWDFLYVKPQSGLSDMLRTLILHLGRQRNPAFSIHREVSTIVLLDFLKDRAIAWLRSLLLTGCKRKTLLFAGKGVKIKGRSRAAFGQSVQLGDAVTINALGEEGLCIGDYSWIGSYSQLKVSFAFHDPGKYIRIGSHVGIGEFAHLGGAGGLEIGDDCIIGPYFSCHPENHRFENESMLIRLQGTDKKGIRIGKNCWIGAKVTILDGVEIGDNCVVAAGAVVNKSMPSNALVAGVPARVIRNRNADQMLKSYPNNSAA